MAPGLAPAAGAAGAARLRRIAVDRGASHGRRADRTVDRAVDRVLAARIEPRTLVLCCGARRLRSACCGGEGHFVFANYDWLNRDAVLADLVRHRLPVPLRSTRVPRSSCGRRSACTWSRPRSGSCSGSRRRICALLAPESDHPGADVLALRRRGGAAGDELVFLAVFVTFTGDRDRRKLHQGLRSRTPAPGVVVVAGACASASRPVVFAVPVHQPPRPRYSGCPTIRFDGLVACRAGHPARSTRDRQRRAHGRGRLAVVLVSAGGGRRVADRRVPGAAPGVRAAG